MARATVDTKQPTLQTYILLDRSGSMRGNWAETIGAMNAYVTELAAEVSSASSKVTLAVFDAPMQHLDFTVLRRSVTAMDWVQVTEREAQPRGYTPLFDAIGRIVSLAEVEDKPERAVIVVITDGDENHSREMTKDGAKAVLDRCREKGWQVVFIGADFDAMSQGRSVGTMSGQTLNMMAGNYAASTQSLARKTRAYGNQAWAGSGAKGDPGPQGSAGISFSAEDRALAAGKAVKETGV